MSESKKMFYLMLSIFGIIIVPYMSAYIKNSGTFDSHYFDFPPLKAEHTYTYVSQEIIALVAVIFALTILFYIRPSLFGFKKPAHINDPDEGKTSVPFPIWFWVGLIVWAGSLTFLAGHFTSPKWFLNWAYIPLYWGLTFLIDGFVYKRTRGKSIFNNHPQELIGIGVASVSGWLLFEYLNFFVLEYWYYPKGDLVPIAEFYTYAIFASSALLPLSFEFYSLFNSYPNFVRKYTMGYKITIGKNFQKVLLAVFFILLFLMSFFPAYLCPVIWLAPLFILTISLDLLGIWTPFSPIKKGNWAPVLLTALTYLVAGFLLEGMNFMSSQYQDGELMTSYPGYWVYNVPFVYDYKIFEMPAVGFYGYLPFGVYCLVWWIAFAYLLNIPTNFAKYEDPIF